MIRRRGAKNAANKANDSDLAVTAYQHCHTLQLPPLVISDCNNELNASIGAEDSFIHPYESLTFPYHSWLNTEFEGLEYKTD